MGDLPHDLTGVVVTGDGRGRKIGFPTANVEVEEHHLAGIDNGVYVARVRSADQGEGSAHLAVVNLGRRPTFGGNQRRLEAHLLDFSGDLYGKPVQVCLLHHVRNEIAFNDAEALASQIQNDIAVARSYFDAEDSQSQSQ